MRMTLTVVDAASGWRDDVTVDAPAAAAVGEVVGELAHLVGTDHAQGSVTIDGRLVDAVTAMVPLRRGVMREGCVVSFGDTSPTAPRAPTTYAELRVVGGPAAGEIYRLAAGTTAVGRAGTVRHGPVAHDIFVDDPDVSRSHAVIDVDTAGSVWVADRGSTNGTWLDGLPVGAEAVPLPIGARLRVGSSTLMLAVPTEPPLVVTPTGSGHCSVNRPPHLHAGPPTTTNVAFPVMPAEGAPPRLPVIATAAPLLAGLLLALMMRRPEYLLFTIVSPVMLAAQWVSDRTGRRKHRHEDTATYDAALRDAQHALAIALQAEAARRRERFPDPATIASAARGPTRRLWERRPGDRDFLQLAIGTGTVRADVAATASDGSPPVASVLADVPVTVALPDVGVLGLAGPTHSVQALARAVVGQLAVLHSPRELGLVLLTDDAHADNWEWLRWLPHLKPVDQSCQVLAGLDTESVAARVSELCTLIDTREHANRAAEVGQHSVVVLIDGAQALRRHAGVAEILARGRAVGVYTVCLDDDESRLPAECGAVALIDGAAGTHLRVRTGERPETCRVITDGVSLSWASRLSRSLAHLRDDTACGGNTLLPQSVRWLELAGLGNDVVPDLLTRWRKPGGGTRGVLGAGLDGPVAFDIAYDGPHALVAGTTGSGKSELLQTIVAALAVANRPDELAFVLIDYKGGAAFGACAALPHTVGLVTDLDGGLVERALQSLRAELKRRESLFAQVGAPHIDAYRATGGRLARLVIVVDEFASLAEEQPSFIGGLVGIAQRGRSLGVHLVLATQRPEGVVSADVRANTNLRISLAVTRESEARDVIDSPAAAHISRSTPGRGYLRTGHGELRSFQCGRVGGRREPATDLAAITVTRSPFRSLCRPAPQVAACVDEHASTDLDLIVASCQQAASELGLQPPDSPWLPPLPNVIPADVIAPDVVRAPLTAVLAQLDLPAEQARRDYVVDLSSLGHLVIAGSARSGRTTALRTLAGGLATSSSVADLHLFVFDCAGGALSTLSALAHCGAVIGPHEVDRARRLMSILTTQLLDRQRRLAAEHVGSLREHQASSADPLPHVVVLIDGWESFITTFDEVDAGSIVEGALRLIREGAAAGIHLVIATDRAGIVGRLASSIDTRLVLRLADRADFSLIGLPARSVPTHLPPGRGFLTDRLVEAQVCVLGHDPSAAAQCAAVEQIAASTQLRDARVPASSRPFRVDDLPTAIALTEIDARLVPGIAAIGPGRAGVVLGVGGDDVRPITVDLLDDGPGFLVTGPPRSGRSTALATIARGLQTADWHVVAVAPRPSLLREHADVVVDPFDVQLEQLLTHDGRRLAVLVDDAELVAETPAAAVLDRLIRRARDAAQVVVIAGATEELSVGFRGFIVDARRNRTGLLLAPRSPLDGELLGVRLPRTTAGSTTAGRGLLVRAGSVTHMQVALPDVCKAARPEASKPEASKPEVAQPQTVTVSVPAATPSWLTCTVTTPSALPM